MGPPHRDLAAACLRRANAHPDVRAHSVWVHRGIVYRRVFTAATISVGYFAAALLFRAFPASIAGSSVGSGLHALYLGGGGRALRDRRRPRAPLPDCRRREAVRPERCGSGRIEWNREALQGDFAEIDLGVLITLVLAISPALAVFAVPTVLLVRRFMVHAQLVAQSRVDAKTGLLNVSTWEREAESELSRAVRTRSPLALALVDIDHFKLVNDTHGHLVGDRVLARGRRCPLEPTARLRPRRPVRRGGIRAPARADQRERCLPHRRATAHARRAAWRCRSTTGPDAPCVRLTISVGVSAIEQGRGPRADGPARRGRLGAVPREAGRPEQGSRGRGLAGGAA